MSRFGNLELGGQEEEHLPSNQSTKDETHYLGQAQAAFEEAEFEKALRHYAKVLEFNPQNAHAWVGQVRALIELGEFDEAKLWADKALERFPQEPELLAAKAVSLGRTGDLQAALAFSDAAIEAQGDTPYIWLARGDVLLARKEKRADYCFDKALFLAKQDWFITWLAARIRHFYRQFSFALQLAKKALESHPGNSHLWLLLGQCQRAVGLIDSAATSLAQAEELNPHSREIATAITDLRHAGLGTRVASWFRRLSHR